MSSILYNFLNNLLFYEKVNILDFYLKIKIKNIFFHLNKVIYQDSNQIYINNYFINL
jgi:hypothetical protein